MLRFIYIRLLRMHPRRFRERYGGEMLWIFDREEEQEGRTLPLLADAAASLWRQWALRPDFRAAKPAVAAPPHGYAPVFYLSESERPRRGALIQGGLLSVGVFAALTFAIAHSASHRRIVVGSHHPSHSHLLAAHAEAASPAELPSEVELKPDGAIHARDLVRRFAVGYFRSISVLDALDSNHDLAISAAELARAPDVLGTLDRNLDGKLSPEECGSRLADIPGAGSRFMLLHPVLAALDTDRNGEISPSEILNASAALGRLDRNGDGKLTLDEVLPDPLAFWTGAVMRLDKNGDGRISGGEEDGFQGTGLAGLLRSADVSRDGVVTEDEVRNEIRRRVNPTGAGAVTWEEMLTAIQSGALEGGK